MKTRDNQNDIYIIWKRIKNYTFLINFVLVVACLHLFKFKKRMQFHQFSSISYVYDVFDIFDVIYHVIGDDVSDKINNYWKYTCSNIVKLITFINNFFSQLLKNRLNMPQNVPSPFSNIPIRQCLLKWNQEANYT